MDFFERQDKARHSTKLLVVYFALGVTLLILTIYLVVLLGMTAAGSRLHHQLYEGPAALPLWDAPLFLGVALGTLAVIAAGSLFKTAQLAQGGQAVAEMLGGRRLNPNATDPDERKLLNVVEEMALASGLPVPQVFVLDAEPGINAFAAGHSSSDAAVTVSRGCLKRLTRDELQGVVGHEFSHIQNGDMRLNLRLTGVLFGILCLAVIGRILLQFRGGRSSRDRNALPLLGLALLLVGWVGVFFGRLIQAAVSRQREFLADASSVQFTRNPDGIAGALRKIGGLACGSKLEAAHADEVSHMFFADGVGNAFFSLMETHPPLEDRIRAIDPNWDGTFITAPAAETDGGAEPAPRGAAARPGDAAKLIPPLIAATALLPHVGTPTPAHLRYAVALRDAFPPSVQTAARDPLGASALVYGLLLSAEPALRARQLQILTDTVSEALRRETERLLPDIDATATRAKLPLVDLALSGLRHFSPAQYQQFSAAIAALIESDGEIDLHEYVLQKIVLRHLDPQFNGARKPVIQFYALKPLAPDCAVLLSAIAHAGAENPADAEAAFRQGASLLADQARSEIAWLAPEQCGLTEVDAALNRLCQAVPQIKKNVLEACARIVAADEVIQESEAELLRAISDTLDCPMPPSLAPL
jgi:Zn-dependent protease with chaperone function